MKAKTASDTPLMRQYLEIKNRYDDAILMYRMGDFYEMFFDDAVVAAEALEVTLTSRDKHRDDPVPMCGVPYHAVAGYIRKLLDQGFKVAICDQVEDPRLARGLVKREVTQVITPGVVLDTDHLEADRNNYLMAITAKGRCFGLAALDLSTFELRATEVEGEGEAQNELARLNPKEIVIPHTSAGAVAPLEEGCRGIWQRAGEECFSSLGSSTNLIEQNAGANLSRLGLAEMPLAVLAGAAALRYAAATQPGLEIPTCRVVSYRPAEYLQLDETTLANLEIFESLMDRRREGSLLWVLDATRTPMGARMMRRVLNMPLLDLEAIRRRHDAVEFLVEHATARAMLIEALRGIYDLERLTSRTVLRVVTPRELGRLARSLRQLPRIASLLLDAAGQTLANDLPQLLRPPQDLMEDVAGFLEQTLVEDPPPLTRDGGMIRQGYNAELDELIQLSEGGRESILGIEARERERTGISSLKVRFNKVFGYFIEVTRSNLKHVPPEYQRKQTLVNAERFVTAELAQYEAKVLGADERRIALEQELFEEVRGRVAAEAARLTSSAEWVAMLDVLCGLATVAQQYDYTRPLVDEGDVIRIEEGRHPVVERFMAQGQFVPNDLKLDPQEGRMVILTGPNMAGKSTVMRQSALITLMAQAGSFVPAREAQVGLVDRIFTRVGASDNLARGESTFMVEMRESASILRNATSRSLIVVDEIGRGTATYDGISIAWAVAEFIHDRVHAKCLFATHYHELCALADVKPFVRNFNIAVQEWKGKVVFLRKLAPGGSSRSYGIEVARLAGLDRRVVARARKVLAALEGDEAQEGIPLRGSLGEGNLPQLSLFSAAGAPASESAVSDQEAAVLEELRCLDPERMTPLAALSLLADLCAKLTED